MGKKEQLEDLRLVLTRLMPFFKDYKKEFAFAIFGMICASLGTALTSYMVKPMLDEIFIDKNEKLLYLLPYAIILIYFVKELGRYIQIYYTAFIGQDIIKKIRNMLLDNLLWLDLEFFYKMRTGELISRNTNDIERIRNVVSNMLPELVMHVITIIGLVVVVIYQNYVLAFFSLVIMPLSVYPVNKIAKKIKKISYASQEKISDISSKLSEIFNNIEIIKAHNAQKYELEKFKKDNELFFNLNLKSVKVGALTSPIMEVLGSIGVAVVIIVGGKEVIDGTMSVGSFFSFLAALFMLYTPLKKISSIYNQLQDAIAASKRTFYLLDLKPKIKFGSKNLPQQINTIKLKDVKVSYDGKNALDGVNLEIQKNKMLALVGESGGGKSTLISLLLRFYEIDSGEILINDESIKNFSDFSLRKNISLVSQRIYLFRDSVAQNVAYGEEIDEKRVIEALKKANAYDFISKLDKGIYTDVLEFGSNFSGGQRQRIAIARALYKNPQIIIFDEATSALDNESEEEITKTLEKLAKDKIIIIIAHRLSTVENANCIAVLDKGKILSIGSDEYLLKNCKKYAKLKRVYKS